MNNQINISGMRGQVKKPGRAMERVRDNASRSMKKPLF
jgi:hypothetical protein